METGKVHIYTGDGKGKSTAAIGLCVRALGRGLRVGFFQFMKNGRSGELEPLKQLGAYVESALCPKFIWNMDEAEKAECRKTQTAALEKARAMAAELDLLALDEAVAAMDCGMLEREVLLDFLREKPRGLEVVLTGRGDILPLRPLADYVTEMRLLAHPFESEGLNARNGIEF